MVTRGLRGLAVVLLLAGTAPVAIIQAQAAPAAPAAPAAGSLHWTACPPVPGLPDQQCATLRVPLDYWRPFGRQITLGVSRVATSKPGLRRGVLLINPGGP